MGAALLALVAVLLAPGAASGAAGGQTTLTPNRHVRFRFGGVALGQSVTQVFTISTARWAHWSGGLTVRLSHSPDFSLAYNGCAEARLTPAISACEVGVTFTPTSTGPRRRFTVLSVGGSRATGKANRTHAAFFSTVLLSGHVAAGGRTGGGSGTPG